MRFRHSLIFTALLGLVLFPARAAMAAPQDDLKSVLDRLNASAASFKSAAANVEYDTVDTDPVPDTDVQKGMFYFERTGKSVETGVHFTEHDGKPSGKAYTYVGGVFKLFEPTINQVTVHSGAGKYESYVMLGFGASGNDLAEKWDIQYLGTEDLSDGNGTVKVARLQLIAKDPAIRKNVSKVVIWVDPDRAVTLKQIFTLSATSQWVCTYTNLKLNQKLPGDAFTFKTNSKTVYQNQ
jgi:outer membrane lipoprotein-sorting protein